MIATFRKALPAIAGAAILLGLVTLNLFRTDNNNPATHGLRNSHSLLEHKTARRQLQVDLQLFNDPKTVLLKSDADAHADADIYDAQQQQQQQQPLPPSGRFPYGFTSEDKNCIPPEEVEGMAWALRELYETHGVRVFPRNGLLLGIIRHGGFLPNEKVPDADLGIISLDVDRLAMTPETWVKNEMLRVKVAEGTFHLARKGLEENWVNWKGMNPVTGEEYPYFGVRLSRRMRVDGISSSRITWAGRSNAVYPYEHGAGGFFFPRLNIGSYNHKSHTEEMLRYNTEGANYRRLDTDELLTEENNLKGKPIGTVFNSALDCMVLKQFYFTMIYVPCDYDEILTAFYGRNWSHVESRGEEGKGNTAAMKVSAEEDLQSLRNGPKPLCASSIEGPLPWE